MYCKVVNWTGYDNDSEEFLGSMTTENFMHSLEAFNCSGKTASVSQSDSWLIIQYYGI